MAFYTYILASQRNGTLYLGSTDTLSRRIPEHKEHIRQGFTAKYGVHDLVWFEIFDTREGALKRERQLKKWNRAWKIGLIEKTNPEWRDLFPEFISGLPLSAHPREGGDPVLSRES